MLDYIASMLERNIIGPYPLTPEQDREMRKAQQRVYTGIAAFMLSLPTSLSAGFLSEANHLQGKETLIFDGLAVAGIGGMIVGSAIVLSSLGRAIGNDYLPKQLDLGFHKGQKGKYTNLTK